MERTWKSCQGPRARTKCPTGQSSLLVISTKSSLVPRPNSRVRVGSGNRTNQKAEPRSLYIVICQQAKVDATLVCEFAQVTYVSAGATDYLLLPVPMLSI